MKLRNKKTGKIGTLYQWGEGNFYKVWVEADGKRYDINSLAELNENWEDYKPKGYWFIDVGTYEVDWCEENEDMEADKEIGNYFETEEEAKKAVEKLKAWKRLKDTYFIEFDLDFVKNTINFTYLIDGTLHSAVNEERIVFEDMKTIFGGEE